jgi:hypothetical protein
MLIAIGAYLFPSFFNRKDAITEVLPVYSSSKPKTVPNTIMRPKFFNMFPKPSFTVEITSIIGSLIPKPTTKQARNNEKNAGTLYRVERITIRTMLTINKTRI